MGLNGSSEIVSTVMVGAPYTSLRGYRFIGKLVAGWPIYKKEAYKEVLRF